MKFIHLKIIAIYLWGLYIQVACAQVMFQKAYTGNIPDAMGTSVLQTRDGGYLIVGQGVESFVTNGDVLAIRTDFTGDTLWTRIFGGIENDYGFGVCQTNDGGFAIIGTARLGGGNGLNIYLVKLDSLGSLVWSKTFDEGIDDYGVSIRKTNDGGFIIAGSSENQTSYVDALLIKTDSLGDIHFSKTFGSINLEDARCAIQTVDGSYAIIGTTSFGVNGSVDFYFIKTDAAGNLVWSKSFGNVNYDEAFSFLQTIDGGYIIIGYTQDLNADVSAIKIDSVGNIIWSNTYGGLGNDAGYSVEQIDADGGYFLIGTTNSFGLTNTDIYGLRLDSSGNILWSKTYGSVIDEILHSSSQMDKTLDGGFVFTGVTINFDSTGGASYLVKTDSNGNSGCNETNPISLAAVNLVQSNSYPTIDYGSSVVENMPPIMSAQGGMVTPFCSTSIEESSNEILCIFPYPNPTTGKLTISSQQFAINEIDFYSLLGKKVFSATGCGLTTVDCGLLPPGIYIVQATSGEKTWRTKVMKE